jgi:hypothetical protein
MAQRVNVVLIDDLDGSEAAETVRFSLDGTNYAIDLSEAHANELRDLLAPYVGVARKLSGQRRMAKRSANGEPSPSDVRAWAREHGHEVSSRGRIPAEVLQAYAAAH